MLLDELKSLRNNPKRGLEFFKRCFLAPHIYVELFESTELKIQAKEAYGKLLKYCFASDKDAAEVLTIYIENPEVEQLPEFMAIHVEFVQILVEYLIYGDSELEGKIGSEIIAKAKQKAIDSIQEELEAILSIQIEEPKFKKSRNKK